ncbi:adenylate/guanylate cyclase domain-containing protein [Bradyrhizobium ganzhouense]|uniref:adenylate/guanylate cyclase domain-containing protein n=1 Tax=Bradyrhizobium ganzhouense TaxID=1179767 RepID=UPI003CFA7779
MAAVLAADVAGYSQLMGTDERGTLEALKAYRREVIDPAIAGHNGRIVKTTGDGMLVEFASAVGAVTCAMAIQGQMAERNGGNTPKIAFRIGINVGDIIIDNDDIFGDGVNLAARVENECAPGGVYLSSNAFEQVRGKTEFDFDDLGERSLKNIDRPVRLFAVRPPSILGGKPQVQAARSLALPDRPSIAVLPFTNMSGDPEQEYFADGIVEDIITALSQFKSLFVIARNSSFTYKGKPVDIKRVGRELGVRYVLEGSVRRSGNRVRITGQLIEAATGAHIWAEKIDGAMEDVFDLQDEVTSRVAGAIEPSIRFAEIGRANTKPTYNLDAYDLFLRAISRYYQFTKPDNDMAVCHLSAATELDSTYTLAKAFLSFNHVTRWNQGWGEMGDREKSLWLAREAIADDSNDAAVLCYAGHALGFWGEYDRALAVLERAARLNVNNSQVLSSLGWVMNYACVDPDRAILSFERAMRLSPRDHEVALMLSGMANANLIADRDEAALSAAQRAIDENPRFAPALCIRIVALAHSGRLDEAKAATAEYVRLDPGFTISTRVPNYRDPAFRQKYHEALRKVGLPK